jgi:hypothetical protein
MIALLLFLLLDLLETDVYSLVCLGSCHQIRLDCDGYRRTVTITAKLLGYLKLAYNGPKELKLKSLR